MNAGKKKRASKPATGSRKKQPARKKAVKKSVSQTSGAGASTGSDKANSSTRKMSTKKTPTKKPATKNTPRKKTAKTAGSDQPVTSRRSDETRFPIVGLGASAGGLEALEEFFRHMPADSGMGFVVVMHQAAKHVSLLPELISRCTTMDVGPIWDRVAVQPNAVYIVPPGKNVDMLNGVLHLTDLPPNHAAPLPIDYFFRSLAQDQRETAVAIVLSGTGADGTAGLSPIKGESGMVMVQSIESARFSGMPQHAVDSGLADYVCSPTEMPSQLVAYARGPFLKMPSLVKNPPPGIEQSLPEILLTLRRRCGHDFSGYKATTICRRIERRMNVHQIVEPKQYLRFLDEHEPEAETLFKELLIGVTSFFRDTETFEAMTRHVLIPALKSKTDDATFRVWVPGCATGEEAYSIAILLRECMDSLKTHLSVQIFATDLNNDAIEAARSGLFLSGISTEVSPQRLSQFFTKEDDHYRIRKELRDWLVFAPQNVIHDPPFTKLDMVSCRNLLIYLQGDLQKKLLTLFHYSLRSEGCLFLGTSETIGEFTDLFEPIDSKAKIFRRRNTTPRREHSVEFPITSTISDELQKRVVKPQTVITPPLADAITQMLVSCFAPPTVIVDRKGQIVHVHGHTGQFLELAPGAPTQDIVSLARSGLELDLSAALRRAGQQDAPVIHENVAVGRNGGSVRVNVTVQRITEPESINGLLRVSFQVVPRVDPPDRGKSVARSTKRRTSREKEIAQELQEAREALQRSIEERDASNEEMKSTNEELQSTNEELQSTNEELETSKEELQSLNEELQTVNVEFQEKIYDLSQANDDMANLLNSTDIATVFLDNQLCIKRFTEQAKDIIRLISTDIGRPLRDLTSSLQHEDLVSDAKDVLKTLAFKECEVCTDDGRWLLMRIIPYRTSEDKIDGLVVTFVDINQVKSVQRESEQARAYAESIVATMRDPLLILDDDLRVRLANGAFYKQFRVTAEATVDSFIYDLGNGQWNIPSLRRLLEEIVPQNGTFDDFEVEHEFPDIGYRKMNLYGRRIQSVEGEPGSILLVIEDVAG